MELAVAAITDVGRVRTNNEDSHFADADLGLFVVCDGMGGHNAGEVASQATCDIVQREVTAASRLRERYLATGGNDDAAALRKMLEEAVGTACREVYKKASKEPELAGMGTTCTVLLVVGHGKAVLAQVGDSRLYVRRGGRLHQLTEDHTYVNELLRRGSITREQARNHPQGNVLSRALGVQPGVAVDTMLFDVDPGDTFLLCSDGLHHYFQDARELEAGLAGDDLTQAATALVKLALARGGHDNCTAIAVRIGGSGDASVAADQRIAVLKNVPLFTHLGYNELVRVVGLTQVARAAAGQVIVREGDTGGELYVLLSGEADVEKGGRPVAQLSTGAHFGEMAMVDSAPRSATVRARTAANLLVLKRPEFFNIVRNEPVIASKLLWSFLQTISGRLRETNEALQSAQQVTRAEPDADFEVFFEEDDG
jgi:serine/threonine protein phosphatase PrpC